MSLKHFRNFDMAFLILISFLGLLLIAVLTVYPPIANVSFPWRKPLIGGIFSSICILGILAVFSPVQCLKILQLEEKEIYNSSSSRFAAHRLSPSLQGHHPSCGNFAAHIFRIRGKTFCAACMGLLLGGLSALTLAFLYFLGNWRIGGQSSSIIVLFGILGVGLGLFQFKFRNLA